MSWISDDILMLRRARRLLADPGEISVLSRGQVAAMAFIFNKPEFLERAGFTMLDALSRLEPFEIAAVEFAARSLYDSTVDKPSFVM